MEIIFNQLSYIENKNSSLEKRYLDDVNFILSRGSISAFIGDNLGIIGNLLMAVKRPSKGEIKIDNMVIKKTTHIDNVSELRKKIGIVSYDHVFFANTVKEEIKEFMNNFNYDVSNVSKHIVDSLKLVGLSEDYLERDPNTLSTSEKKKLTLACIMSYNPEVIILNNFDYGLIFRDKEYFKKLFLKLKTKFNKTIIIITNDLTFTFGIVDKVYVINKAKLVLTGGKEIFYDKNLYRFIEMPKIVDFTMYAKENGHDIAQYIDTKELLKELYRNVK